MCVCVSVSSQALQEVACPGRSDSWEQVSRKRRRMKKERRRKKGKEDEDEELEVEKDEED